MNAEDVAMLFEALALKDKEGPLMLLQADLKVDGEKRLVLRLIGMFLGNMIGEVREIDVSLSGECVEKYIRVRVVIDIDKPLRRILRVDVIGDGKETTMLLRYERLPDHCFRYERVGHVVRECLENARTDCNEDYNLLFGAWLRASSPLNPITLVNHIRM
ncbi:hypothetical protein Ddye_000799 [Dipteronia dyeriana]|uniref:Zinc knuckle CX2CX4HX4C domain-containing protein n=1 Tax=Dipteronia dyeriana TaxID=168575 RepID=A0AAD9XN10_9ROSI|nr:hypothetical protein Ddye_000799 [Dipteronia dyeriana]